MCRPQVARHSPTKPTRSARGTMQEKIRAGTRVRLVKGAFAARRDIAYASQREIKANYRKLASIMLSGEALSSGFYPIFATHDDVLRLVERGERVRLYTRSCVTSSDRAVAKSPEYMQPIGCAPREQVGLNLALQREL
jgi:hypothetical protein